MAMVDWLTSDLYVSDRDGLLVVVEGGLKGAMFRVYP